MLELISILVIVMWGMFTAILHVFILGLRQITKSILTGISLYVAMVLAIIIGKGEQSWIIFLAFLFLIPGGIGISYLVNWFLALAPKEKVNTSHNESRKNKQTRARFVILIFDLLAILLMALINTPISTIAQSLQPIAVGSTALAVTTVICTLFSVFSLTLGYIILVRDKIILVNYNVKPVLSMLFAFVPSVYGTVVFLVTGNTEIGIFFDAIALASVLFFVAKLILKEKYKNENHSRV